MCYWTRNVWPAPKGATKKMKTNIINSVFCICELCVYRLFLLIILCYVLTGQVLEFFFFLLIFHHLNYHLLCGIYAVVFDLKELQHIISVTSPGESIIHWVGHFISLNWGRFNNDNKNNEEKLIVFASFFFFKKKISTNKRFV